MLIASGADPHAAAGNGETPLHWAAKQGHADAARLLLRHGANPNAVDARGQTPLHLASWKSRHEVIQLLIEAGARTDLRSSRGQTPAHAAQRPDTIALVHRLSGGEPKETPTTLTPAEMSLALHRIRLHPTRPEAITAAHNAVLTRWSLTPDGRATPLVTLMTTHASIAHLAVAPAGDVFAITTSDTTHVEFRRWSDLTVVDILDIDDARQHSLTSLDLSPDGRWIVVANVIEDALLIDRATRRIVARAHAGEWTGSIRFSPDSRLLAIACSYQGGAILAVHELNSDGTLTALHEWDRNDDRSSGSRYVDVLAHLAFSPDGTALALYETARHGTHEPQNGWRGNAAAYDLSTGRLQWTAPIDAAITGDPRSLSDAGHPGGFHTEIAPLSNRTFACGTPTGVLFLRPLPDGVIASLSTPRHTVTSLAAAPNGVWAALDPGELRWIPS